MKKFLLFILTLFILNLTGCNLTDMPSIDGWWRYEHRITGVEVTPPYDYMEVKEDSTVYFYNTIGEVTDVGTYSRKEGIVIKRENSEYGDTQYYAGMKKEHDVWYIVLTSDHYYSKLDRKPEFVIPEEETEDDGPFDPIKEANGFWIFDESSADITDPTLMWKYLEKSDGYMTVYDTEGTVIIEGVFYYDYENGMYTGDFNTFLGIPIDYQAYDDVEKIIIDGWHYNRIEELPFEKKVFSPVGEWKLEEPMVRAFDKIEILSETHEDGGNIICTDENGDILDVGYYDYSTVQGYTFGNPVIIVSFPNIDVFATYLSKDGDAMYVAYAEDWEFNGGEAMFYRYDRLDVLDNSQSIEDKSTYLLDTLGDEAEGKTIVETGVETINGEECTVFAFGTNTDEKFIAEKHFAVDKDGKIYILDIIAGGEWVKYQP